MPGISIIPLPGPGIVGGYIEGHPGLRHRPCVVRGVVRISFQSSKSPPRLAFLSASLTGICAACSGSATADAAPHVDETVLISRTQTLVDTAVPVKLSALTLTDVPEQTNGNSFFDVKFKIELSAREAAELPPSVELLKDLGIRYEVMAKARFAGTFENTEIECVVPLVWPRFHPDAVARVVGGGQRVRRDGPGWSFEFVGGVGSRSDLRWIKASVDTKQEGSAEPRTVPATVIVTLVETWTSNYEGKNQQSCEHKGERVLTLNRVTEDKVGDFQDRLIVFALPPNIRPTLRYKQIDIQHRLRVTISTENAPRAPNAFAAINKSSSPTSSEPAPLHLANSAVIDALNIQQRSHSLTDLPPETEQRLNVTSEIPYPIAAFTREECDDLVATADNLPQSALCQIPTDAIGRRLKDLDFAKDATGSVVSTAKLPGASGGVIHWEPKLGEAETDTAVESKRPWNMFEGALAALKIGKKVH